MVGVGLVRSPVSVHAQFFCREGWLYRCNHPCPTRFRPFRVAALTARGLFRFPGVWTFAKSRVDQAASAACCLF